MAGQDYKRHIPAGGSTRINANGETYIFCKFSDRDVTVDIAGRKVVMRTGSYMEFAPLRGENSAVTIYNDDSENPAAVLFVLGVGTYDEKLVRGEISVEPILRNADGTTKPDTRGPLIIDMAPVNAIFNAYSQGDIVRKWTAEPSATPGATIPDGLFHAKDGALGFFWHDDNNVLEIQTYEKETLNLIDRLSVTTVVIGNVHEVGYLPGVGYLLLDNGNKLRNLDGEIKFNFDTLPVYNVRSFDYDPDNDWLVCRSQTDESVIFIDRNFNLIKQIDMPQVGNHQGIRVDYWTGNYCLFADDGTTNVMMHMVTPTGEPVETLDYTDTEVNFSFPAVPDRLYLYCDIDGEAGSVRAKVAMRDFVKKPEVETIQPGCQLGQSLIKQDIPVQVTADITGETLGGSVRIEGEVIKAALEFHYRRKAPDDYLDHVYQLDLGRDGAGQPVKTIRTGNGTFARAGIADNFTTLWPGRVALVIDNELDMGVSL